MVLQRTCLGWLFNWSHGLQVGCMTVTNRSRYMQWHKGVMPCNTMNQCHTTNFNVKLAIQSMNARLCGRSRHEGWSVRGSWKLIGVSYGIVFGSTRGGWLPNPLGWITRIIVGDGWVRDECCHLAVLASMAHRPANKIGVRRFTHKQKLSRTDLEISKLVTT